MTDSQLRFIRLHQRHFVREWRALFERGITATITIAERASLIEAGLMEAGRGQEMILTPRGQQV